MCECVTTKTDVDIQEQNNGNWVKKKLNFCQTLNVRKLSLFSVIRYIPQIDVKYEKCWKRHGYRCMRVIIMKLILC